jgi:hypothetical protein
MATVPQPKGDLEASLGAKFRAERRANGVWLRDLASALDVSVNTIRWHEAGARMLRADMLVKAAEVIGVNPSALMPPDAQQQLEGGDLNG